MNTEHIQPIHILLVDDHALLREALREKLEREQEFVVVGEAGNAESAMQLIAANLPDVVVLDISLPDKSGVELAREIKQRYPAVRIVAFSMHDEHHVVAAMIKAGASGYVTKTADRTALAKAIRETAIGNEFLSPDASAKLVRKMQERGEERAELTVRERQVLELLARGLRSQEVANLLNISPLTVDVHRRNIMRKLGLHSIAQLTRYAIREGIATP